MTAAKMLPGVPVDQQQMFRARIWRGAVVLISGTHQAVVQRAVDGEPVTVVRTFELDRSARPLVEQVDVSLLRPAPVRKQVATCAICGDVWKVHGERTSHCPACHETFEGGTVWNAHRVETSVPGSYACRRASSMEYRGERLRKQADAVVGLITVGTWRGPKLAAGTFGGDA